MGLILIITIIKTCPGEDEFCASCDGSKCKVCYNSYLDSTNKCKEPKNKIENCLKYLNENKCLQCKLNYYLNNDGKCNKIPFKNCLVLKSADSCKICKDSFLPHNNKCSNSTKKCSIKNCNLCSLDNNNKEKCFFCDDGYAVFYDKNNNTTCIKENDNNQNCHYLNKNNSNQCA